MAGWYPNNTTEIACYSANQCRDYIGERFGLLPVEYVGWAILALFLISCIAIPIAIIYFSAEIDERKKENSDPEEEAQSDRKHKTNRKGQR